MFQQKSKAAFFTKTVAAALLLAGLVSTLPAPAQAASSSEIRRQINILKEEKKIIGEKIEEVKEQYQVNENEIADIIARKNVIDQEVQLLYDQIENINQQISSFNVLIADKQDELDNAQSRYETLSAENKDRIRTMEERGAVSYWEVVFNANSFSDLLDRLTIVEEIADSDNRRLKELGQAAENVEVARLELTEEKDALEVTKQELDATELAYEEKKQEAYNLLQELLTKADDLTALQAEFEAQEAAFLVEIAKKEDEYSAAKAAEWAAYMATYVPPTQGAAGAPGGGSGGAVGSNGWVVPCNYTSVTSPFGNRNAPTAGASSNHMGIDLDTGTGWSVVAANAGRVVAAGYSNSAGNYVKIDHGNGVTSIYMHLNNSNVSAGQMVGAGQQIGATGATGVATGDHLHFGIAVNGAYVNPGNYINFG